MRQGSIGTENHLVHGDARNGRVARLHNIWRGMLKRCNPELDHPKYSGRGIRVCEEWKVYATFRAWALAHGYADNLSIERRDNDGHYTPGNCRWLPMARQAVNRRNTRRITFRGQTRAMADWARMMGIGQSTLRLRLDAGWPVGRALTTPVKGRAA